MKSTVKGAHGAKLGISLAFCFGTLGYAQEVPAPHTSPGNWNNTFISFRHADDFYFPGSPKKVAQDIGSMTTTGGFKYGGYVFTADYLVSDGNNPEVGGTSGAQEVYSVARVEWSASKILGHPMNFGVIRDIGLTTGFDFSAKNDAFSSAARMLVVGPTVQFDIPRGYWNATAGWRTETNYNGIVHQDVRYSTAWHVESSWLIPFHLGPVPTVFKGFASVTGPKGLDGFHVPTETETLTRMSVLFDVGALAGHPRALYIGPGYEYWNNMFGTPSSKPGTQRSAPMLVAEFHF